METWGTAIIEYHLSSIFFVFSSFPAPPPPHLLSGQSYHRLSMENTELPAENVQGQILLQLGQCKMGTDTQCIYPGDQRAHDAMFPLPLISENSNITKREQTN